MIQNDWGVSTYPMVPGHEGVGKIHSIGASVTNLKIGGYVVIGWIRDSCSECKNCLIGKDNICLRGYQGTFLSENAIPWGKQNFRLGGTFAEYVNIEVNYY
jgi:D-arabinose 1-dehydrogenase-like Zn-dependent alcohol dehydrogenase